MLKVRLDQCPAEFLILLELRHLPLGFALGRRIGKAEYHFCSGTGHKKRKLPLLCRTPRDVDKLAVVWINRLLVFVIIVWELFCILLLVTMRGEGDTGLFIGFMLGGPLIAVAFVRALLWIVEGFKGSPVK